MREKVLIISDDAEFSAALLRNWQSAGPVPDSEVLGLNESLESAASCVAVLDGAEALSRLPADVALAIVVSRGPTAESVDPDGRTITLGRGQGWDAVAAALAAERVLREKALQQVRDLEVRLCSAERFSAMGCFIAGQQHELANALTSLMGHAELLMIQRDLDEEVRRKVGTILAMSLRINDVLQQLSALDRELLMAERKAVQEKSGKPAANGAGK